MEILIVGLIALNMMLGIAVFVANMVRMDQRYTQRVREEEGYYTYFRTGRRPDE